jgi:hypothetical protein
MTLDLDITNWISAFLFLQIFCLILGILVACFAEKVFWWWFDLLSHLGKFMATHTGTKSGLWVPELPNPSTIRTEQRFLRVVGIVLASISVLSIFPGIILQ